MPCSVPSHGLALLALGLVKKETEHLPEHSHLNSGELFVVINHCPVVFLLGAINLLISIWPNSHYEELWSLWSSDHPLMPAVCQSGWSRQCVCVKVCSVYKSIVPTKLKTTESSVTVHRHQPRMVFYSLCLGRKQSSLLFKWTSFHGLVSIALAMLPS